MGLFNITNLRISVQYKQHARIAELLSRQSPQS